MRFDRVAITGGSGRLGAFVVEELRRHCDVTVLDLNPPHADVAFEPLDVLGRTRMVETLQGYDAVVHLAGIDLDTETEADRYLTTNVVGTWNVLEAAEECGVRRVVLCSSITATGLSEARPDFPPHYLPVDEDHPMKPQHAYSVSKQMVELAGDAFNRPGAFDVISLRLMLVMLPHNHALAQERAADPATRWLFYYITPQDAAVAFRCALEADALPYTRFYITAADTCHPAATLEWVERAQGALPKLRNPDFYADSPRASIFDGTRAREVLEFSPSSNWLDLSSQTESQNS